MGLHVALFLFSVLILFFVDCCVESFIYFEVTCELMFVLLTSNGG